MRGVHQETEINSMPWQKRANLSTLPHMKYVSFCLCNTKKLSPDSEYFRDMKLFLCFAVSKLVAEKWYFCVSQQSISALGE